MNIAGRLQDQINATQAFDALTYGIRSIELTGSRYGGSATHVEQIATAEAVADWRLARDRTGWEIDHGIKRRLLEAKKLIAADLAAIKARLRMAGTKGQLRLALAAA